MSVAPDGRVLSPGEVYTESVQPDRPQEWQEDLNVTLMCPDCRENPPNLVEEFSSGDTVCGSCGRVLADRIIDTRSEWRTFSNDDQGNDDPSRVGEAANPLLNGSQLQTEISYGDGNVRSRDLHRAQNRSSHDKGTKTLLAAYKAIGTFAETSNMPHIVADTAKHLFKMVDDAKVFKGKSQDAIIAGCIFIACRQNNVPRSFREIFKLTNVAKKEIGRTFKKLEEFLSTVTRQNPTNGASGGAVLNPGAFKVTKSTEAHELIGRACSKLNLDRFIGIIAQEAAARVAELGVAAGRSPLSITGACIYLVAGLMGEPRSPRDIGAAVDVSDGTIRTAYKLIYQERDKVIKDEWIERGGDINKIPQS
ncbi:transcription initiation factor-like protein iib [Lophium mytilinum]|uniref:Transcription initiation factor IIB n=1 Tax=Lophium mytilinum TaxID=390894 RepID=A0A6A6QX13_9PEZI|nr:transcription initiation factor-like protein iib [Lophium mytilinum]